MTKKIKPNAYDDDGYSHVCKACMARDIVDGSVVELDRTLRHIFRDMEALIKSSDSPVAVKVRKHAGMDLRREKISHSMNGLLGAFYDVWVDLEERMDHEKAAVKEFRTARKKGGVAKHANDPVQAAKAYAVSHWPEANRRGSTAREFHNRVTNAGHVVAADTFRKWVTKLRKTGTC